MRPSTFRGEVVRRLAHQQRHRHAAAGSSRGRLEDGERLLLAGPTATTRRPAALARPAGVDRVLSARRRMRGRRSSSATWPGLGVARSSRTHAPSTRSRFALLRVLSPAGPAGRARNGPAFSDLGPDLDVVLRLDTSAGPALAVVLSRPGHTRGPATPGRSGCSATMAPTPPRASISSVALPPMCAIARGVAFRRVTSGAGSGGWSPDERTHDGAPYYGISSPGADREQYRATVAVVHRPGVSPVVKHVPRGRLMERGFLITAVWDSKVTADDF